LTLNLFSSVKKNALFFISFLGRKEDSIFHFANVSLLVSVIAIADPPSHYFFFLSSLISLVTICMSTEVQV